jgi:hypothetical protein
MMLTEHFIWVLFAYVRVYNILADTYTILYHVLLTCRFYSL